MSTKSQTAAEQPVLVEVVLDKAHTHKGQPYTKGDKIKVTEDQKAWLTKHGVISGQQKEQSNG